MNDRHQCCLPRGVPTAPVVFYKNYSRQLSNGEKESFDRVVHRVVNDIGRIGDLSIHELDEIYDVIRCHHAFPSGRALWIAGTRWAENSSNVSGYYNCTSTFIDCLGAFATVLNLCMMGCGTGTVLESDNVELLPPVRRRINLHGVTPVSCGCGGVETTHLIDGGKDGGYRLQVGDSRQGWVDSLVAVFHLAFVYSVESSADLIVDLTNVRSAGCPLRGFGGVANPVELGSFYVRVVKLLNSAYGRRLTPGEACRLLDEACAVVVAGNIRRSAGLRQFSFSDLESRDLKRGLYTATLTGQWRIDSDRAAMRLAAHTRIIHHLPSLEEVEDSITRQFETGEGAIEYAPEAMARGNADLFDTVSASKRVLFMRACEKGGDAVRAFLQNAGIHNTDEQFHRMHRYGLNPCGEIIGHDFHCNLSEVHLNMIEPDDVIAQERAFSVAGVMVAALLQQWFPDARFQRSREFDPIVGVSFTGLFDFFIRAFGFSWLEWMMNGRPENSRFPEFEKVYLKTWRNAAWRGVRNYCLQRKIRVPNRITAVQPAGTKSLLTGASPGWHPPKAIWYIRRIIFSSDDPVLSVCRSFGYRTVRHLDSCDEWFVEIPMKVGWADLVKNDIDLTQIPAKAQWGLYMMVQTVYTDHNTSATIELNRDEIPVIARLVHEAMGKGYVSCAFMARCSACFPGSLMPIQPISRREYLVECNEVLLRRVLSTETFETLMCRIMRETRHAQNSFPESECGGMCGFGRMDLNVDHNYNL